MKNDHRPRTENGCRSTPQEKPEAPKKVGQKAKAVEGFLDRYRKVLDGIYDGLVVFDRRGRILYANAAFQEMTRLGINELSKRTYWDLTPEKWHSRGKQIVQELLREKGTSRIYETELVRRGNEPFPAEIRIHPVPRNGSGPSHLFAAISDISYRKKVEENLRQSEKSYKKITEKASDAVFTIAPDGTVTSLNVDLGKATGWSREEWVGKSFVGILHPDDVSLALSILPRVMGGEMPPPFEVRLASKLGGYVPVECVAAPAFRDGRVVGAVGIARNISERRRFLEALEKSEQEARRLSVENAALAEIGRIISSTLDIEEVYERFVEGVRRLFSVDRILISINNPAEGTLSIAYVAGAEVQDSRAGSCFPFVKSVNEQLLNRRSGMLFQLEDEVDLAERFPLLVDIFQIGIRSLLSIPLISNDKVIGGLHIQSFNSGAYTEEDLRVAERIGLQISGAVANAQLYAERKQAEQKLERSEEKYRLVVENAKEAICVAQEGKLVFLNAKMKEFLGCQGEELPSFVNLIHPDDRDMVLVNYRKRLAGEPVPDDYAFRIVAQGGNVLWVNISGIRIDWKGRPATLNFFSNVTEKKKAEEKLLASEEKARRLAAESTAVAEIGRIMSSTLNVEEIYQRFAEAMRKIISFDRIVVSLNNLRDKTSTIAYVSGIDIEGRRVGDVIPFSRPANDYLFQKRPSRLIRMEKEDQLFDGFTPARDNFQSGIRSLLSIPLILEDHAIGSLYIQSVNSDAYTDEDLRFAERVGSQISGAIANAQLYTELKRTETELRREISFRTAMMERLAEGLCVCHEIAEPPYTEFTVWNDHMTEITGYTVEEINRLGWYQTVYPDPEVQSRVVKRMARMRQGDDLLNEEWEITRADGEKRMLCVSTSVVHTSEGDAHVLALMQDVTGRKRAEENLRKSEENYRLVVENASEGICITQDGLVKYVNPKLQEMSGFSEEELIMKPFAEFIHPDDREMVLNNHLKRLSGEFFPDHYSFRILRKDGNIRYLRIGAVLNVWDGRPATLNFLTDITVQTQAMRELLASEERFRNLVETTSDLIWEIDETSGFVYVSPKILDLLGYEPHEAIGRKLHDFLLPGELERLHAFGFEAKEQKNAFNRVEGRFLHKKGHTVVLETSGVPRYDERGRFFGYRGISRDVTERRAVEEELENYRKHLEQMIEERTSQTIRLNTKLKREIGDHQRTEEILRESMRRYREMIETTLEGVCIADGEGKILFVNRRFAVMTGYGMEEMVDRPVFEFVDELFLSQERTRLERSRAGVKEQRDSCLRRKDGSKLWTIISSNPMFDEKQHFVGSLLMITNITERKNIEEKIHRSKVMLQKFFDGISEPLVMIDRDLNVVMLNVAARDYCGAQWDEIVGKPYHQTSTYLGPFEEFDIRSAFTQGQDFAGERKSPRDPNRLEKVVIYPLKEDGRDIQNAIIRISDVTEEKLLHKQLVQNEKLAALGLLISGIAHEINNPNNFISFNIPMLREFLLEIMSIVDLQADVRPNFEVCGMPYPEFREDIFRLLENLEHGAERINNTVSNLREFATAKERQELRLVDPREIIGKAMVICQGELNKRVKRFEEEIEETLPRFFTDAGSLEQVMVNLLINSCQSMDKEDSWLRIRAFSGTPHDHLVIEVIDNGCGMDEATLERLFEPFFSTKKPGTGTGLGLYVSRNLVERLGGEIVVNSEPGKGTTFRVILPRLDRPVNGVQDSQA